MSDPTQTPNPGDSGSDDPTQNPGTEEFTTAPAPQKSSFIKSLKAFYTNPNTRVNALLLTGIAVVMVAFGVWDMMGGSKAKIMSNPGSTQNVRNLPGGDKGGALYDKNLNQLNAERAKQAAQAHQTFIPTLGALHKVAPPKPAPAPKPAPTPPKPAPAPAPAPKAAPAAPKETAYQKDEAKDAQMELMRFVNEPVPVPLTTSLRVLDTKGMNDGHSVPVPATHDLTGKGNGQNTGPVLANAGHITFGEMVTAINSNEPGPVEAKIVSGRFNGALLLGKFKREDDRVVVHFDEMTWKHQGYAISAYAINAKNARTYVATSVNHHTLLRWGSLIAASLVGGLSNALEESNSSTTIGNGFAVVQNQLSDGQIALSAAGNVGQTLTPIMLKQFKMPPTVREAQGSPIGILFMKPVQ